MAEVMNWLAPIIVATIAGGFSYLGVAKTIKASNNKNILEIKNEQDKQLIIIGQQIDGIKNDIKRLETKQDKHNNVIERTFKLEQKLEDLEKRMK